MLPNKVGAIPFHSRGNGKPCLSKACLKGLLYLFFFFSNFKEPFDLEETFAGLRNGKGI